MKLFLDSANVVEISTWQKLMILDGVTTNPTSLSKQKEDPTEVIKALCTLFPGGLVHVEVTDLDPDQLYKQAKRIAAIAQNVIVKIPCKREYYDQIGRLVLDGIPVNVTLVFGLMQAVCMAKLGVAYVSPFIGRLDTVGLDGIQLVNDLQKIYHMHGYKTNILAASIHSIRQVHDSLLAGIAAITVSVDILEQMTIHPLTIQGLDIFSLDWKKKQGILFPSN